MKDERPTVVAEEKFWEAGRWFRQGAATRTSGYNANPAEFATLNGLITLTEGLKNLSIGVRATYLLLEEVQKQTRSNAQRIDRLSER